MRLIRTILGTICAVLFAVSASGQSITLTANKTIADGRLVPVLTWATSPVGAIACTASGAWSGTKAGAGSQTVPEITASTVYSLTCSWPTRFGSALVSWNLPSTNTDGSALTNLAGTRIYFGSDPSAFTKTLDVTGATASSGTVDGLAAGTWYFKVRPFNTNDVEAADSNVASKLITVASSTATVSLPITIRPVPNPATITTISVVGLTPFVPVFRVNSAGTAISSTPFGLIPVGRACAAKVCTWRGVAIHRVEVDPSEVWPKGSSTANLAAPCA